MYIFSCTEIFEIVYIL